ncbi:hypothetical protein [Listeria booriae]|uniref:DNA-binding protein n=1 Tax=Listeria booriae TaxID=1552123 RepID=A0A7X0Z8U2_9LIST|nr:hypothetical protein [Listeria booriae]MBC1491030.1 hypothetical protein [Listeria booriae]MBC1491055.1 hypothetical protein [Listeria booriae]MBC2177737.1 hypothetical protein [Listeria booriae]MBC2177842.1 hypothetical protein [Listeria booriae]MBC2293011.1 hypothetical protein [Listeria booriae]
MERDKVQQVLKEHILTTAEARAITNQSPQAFKNAVLEKRILPIYHHERVRLFWKEDVLKYAAEVKKRKAETFGDS